MPDRDTAPLPTCINCFVLRSNTDMRLDGSVGGVLYSYRTPGFRVRVRRAFQSSCTNPLYAVVRWCCGLSDCDWIPNDGRPSNRSPMPLIVKAPENEIDPRVSSSRMPFNLTFRTSTPALIS